MIDCKVGDFFIGWREHLACDHCRFINLVCVYERACARKTCLYCFVLNKDLNFLQVLFFYN